MKSLSSKSHIRKKERGSGKTIEETPEGAPRVYNAQGTWGGDHAEKIQRKLQRGHREGDHAEKIYLQGEL